MLTILPSYQTELTELLGDEVRNESAAEVQNNIPISLYASVLNSYATTHSSLLFWSVSQLILQQALMQLVSGPDSIEIVVAQCMPPTYKGKIHSLREIIRSNSRTWSNNSQHRSSFFGVRQAMRNRSIEQPLTLLQAEQQVWQQIEEELLEIPLRKR